MGTLRSTQIGEVLVPDVSDARDTVKLGFEPPATISSYSSSLSPAESAFDPARIGVGSSASVEFPDLEAAAAAAARNVLVATFVLPVVVLVLAVLAALFGYMWLGVLLVAVAVVGVVAALFTAVRNEAAFRKKMRAADVGAGAEPVLQHIVSTAAELLEVSPRDVLFIDDTDQYAYVDTNSSLVVYRGLARKLSTGAMLGVVAHEFAHVRNGTHKRRAHLSALAEHFSGTPVSALCVAYVGALDRWADLVAVECLGSARPLVAAFDALEGVPVSRRERAWVAAPNSSSRSATKRRARLLELTATQRIVTS